MGTVRRSCGLLLLLVFAAVGLPAATAQSGTGQTVNIVQVVGIIDSEYADYIRAEIRHSEKAGHTAVVLRLDSPGTVKINEADLISAVSDARIPVATWVGPGRARVRGGAGEVWLAGDLRFVGTDALAVDRVDRFVGEFQGRPMVVRGASDVTAAELLASEIATRSTQPVPPGGEGKVVAGTVNSLPDAVRNLDGRRVTVDGTERTLDVDTTLVKVRFASPNLLRRFHHPLNTIPNLIYLLLIAGAAALVFELFQPGFGPSGYVGVLLLALAVIGLVGLPTNPIGVALVVVGLAALALDVARGGLGVFTWGGTTALAAGSYNFVHADAVVSRVSWWTMALGVVGSWVFFVVVMTVVLRSLRGQQAAVGRAILGLTGEVRSTLNPQGHVLVGGSLWRARAIEWDGPVATGTYVTVTGVDEDALVLDVEPVSERG